LKKNGVGASAGALLGEIVVENIINNLVYLACELYFGKTAMRPTPLRPTNLMSQSSMS
jgi:hypothetical protein